MRGDRRRTARGQDERQGASGAGDRAAGGTEAKHRAAVERLEIHKKTPPNPGLRETHITL